MSSAHHRPRSMICVCFANPCSLGVAEPFLTQKQPFLSRSSEPFLIQNVTGFTFLSTLRGTKFSTPGYPGLLNLVDLTVERKVKPVYRVHTQLYTKGMRRYLNLGKGTRVCTHGRVCTHHILVGNNIPGYISRLGLNLGTAVHQAVLYSSVHSSVYYQLCRHSCMSTSRTRL
jgi:hypothetical protein